MARSLQHSHAHSLLGRCLKEHGVDYDVNVTPVTFGKYGKPSLAEHPGLHYNISHADGIAAVMVSGHECGIDCEPIRRYDPRIMMRVCSEAERETIEAASENERELLFFSLWTLKEAYVKAIGKGLAFPLREAAFAFDEDRILTELNGCSFARYIIGGEFVVSVCELADSGEAHRTYNLQLEDGHCVTLTGAVWTED